MKNRKFLTVVSILLLITNLTINVKATTIYEEDEIEEDVLNEEYFNINDLEVGSLDIENLRVTARNAIAIDGKTNQILYEQNPYEVVAMASTTKIITALVAISEGNLDREIEVSKKAASIRGSTVGYGAGEKVKLRELLFGLMYKSGNDAAIAIAEGLAGSVENFAKLMNQYAVSLGLVNSHFESPHGLDSAKHYSCAYDLAVLTSKAMENEFFREICGTKVISRDKYGFTRDYNNINKILWRIPNANGVKTGYTGQAGKCLVSSVRHADRDVIIVVLNCTDRWNQTEKIFKYVESNYQFASKKSTEILESNAIQNLGSIIEDEDFEYGFKEEEKIDIEVFKPLNDIEKGDIVGKISLNKDEKVILKQDIKSNECVKKSKFYEDYIEEEDVNES